MSDLTKAVNNKIIIQALTSGELSTAPISACCSFKSSASYGPIVACGTTLDREMVEMAMESLAILHSLLSPDVPLDNLSAGSSQTSAFEQSLNEIAQCMLCDMHRSVRAVDDLVRRYLDAIMQSAKDEQEEVDKAATANLRMLRNTIEADLSEHARRKPDRSAPASDTRSHTRKARRPSTPPRTRRPQASPPTSVEEDSSDEDDATVSGASSDQSSPAEHVYAPRKKHHASTAGDARIISAYEKRWQKLDFADSHFSSESRLLRHFPWPMIRPHKDGITYRGAFEFYSKAVLHSKTAPEQLFRREKLAWHPDRIDYKAKDLATHDTLQHKAATVFRALLDVEKEHKRKQKQAHRKTARAGSD